MIGIRGLIAAGAALAISGFGASAADLYGGRGSIKDDYIAPPVVQSGCGTWYARIDGGYSSYDRPSMTETFVDDLLQPNIKNTWSLGGGIGRYFSCNIRGDITYDHRFNSDVTGFNGNIYSPVYGSHKFGIEGDTILFNAYYDFDTRTRFTPYIGVGLGVAHNQINAGRGVVGQLASSGGFGDTIAVSGNDTWHAAAAVMAGFTVPLRDRLSLDAGYRFLYLGNAKTGQISDTQLGGRGGPTSVDELHAHEFRFGLRMDLGGGGSCCVAAAPLK